MVDYSIFPLDDDIKSKLAQLEISYAFQPIFYSDGKEIYAHEALMRPKNISVTDLIEEFRQKDELHTLEVATIFGAVQCYAKRGYHSYIAINSFPAESFTDEELAIFDKFYADVLGDKGIIEILEYTALDVEKWQSKKGTINRSRFNIALDDFGTGNNNMMAVDIFSPHIVKLDRSLITGIENDVDKQEYYFYCRDNFHRRGIKVLGEGIESREEYEFLRDNGIDYVQGFYLGRPE